MWLVGFPVSVVTFCSICDGRGIRAHAVTRGYTRLHAVTRGQPLFCVSTQLVRLVHIGRRPRAQAECSQGVLSGRVFSALRACSQRKGACSRGAPRSGRFGCRCCMPSGRAP